MVCEILLMLHSLFVSDNFLSGVQTTHSISGGEALPET